MSVPSFSGSAASAGVSPLTPIAGDGEMTMFLLADGTMTSGDLAPGDVGDASTLLGMSVEFQFSFQADATPASTQFLVDGPEVSAGVRQWAFTVTTTGAISLTVRHATSGAITATSSAGLAALQPAWSYVWGTVLGASLVLYVNGTAVATTAWPAGAVANASYGAGVSDIRIGGNPAVANPENWYFSNLAFLNYGLPAARVTAQFQAATQRGFPTQLTGARVSAALDAAGSTAPRSIGAGARSVTPTYMRGQTPKSVIDEALAAEAVDAVFFTKADGTLVFLDSAHRSSSPYNTSQATFGDAAGELAYVGINVVYDDASIANEWNVTREGSTGVPAVTQSVSDTTSISRYFSRSQSLTSIPVPADSDALNIATAYLAKYKDPLYRIIGLTFSTLDPNVSEAIFRREIGDKITVLRTPPGGGSRISQVLWIQKIEVSGANDGGPWTVSWVVSPV